ncbi:hypothetical protein BJX64DRAFT_274291 [Aspergillus heterothallicus]
MLFIVLLFGLVAGQDEAFTSEQWLITLNTSIFWPTSTNYYYGPTTGPSASAVSCNAEWVEWAGRSSGLWSLGATSYSTSLGSYATSEGACRTSVSLEQWSDTHTGSLTTLCDGAPRAVGPRETVTRYYPGDGDCVTGYQTFTETSTFYREPSPSPTCPLETSDCVTIWQTYSSLSSEWRSANPTTTPGDTKQPIPPYDCPTPSREYPEENPCSNCHFLPGTATLFYWPVTTASGDLCLQNGTNLPATGPSTAVVNGETFVSPTVYLSFTSIYAWSNRRGHAGFQCGVDHFDQVIGVNPETLYSVRHHRNAKYPTYGTAYPFNFAEFMPQEIGAYTQSLIPWPQFRGGEAIDAGWTVCDRDWYIPPVTMVALDQETITIAPTATATEEAFFAEAVPQGGVAAETPEPTRGW